ncbi:MAG: hypothetical protein JW883_01820 [Deltaproteobacteria bacterium]|nr:hypothetical protein [Deltaproteobacteria bacterium]
MTFRARLLKIHPAVIVLASFLLAIIVGSIILKLPISTINAEIPWVDSFFTATSAVCVTGLVVVDTGSYFTFFGQCVILVLIQIGASPGSCGGGVKTTTLALLAAFTASRIRRKRRVNIFKKSIPNETVTRSISLILVSFGIIGLVLFMLLVGDSASGHVMPNSHGSFLAYLFETVSAFGTVGLSMGVTPDLTIWGKCWIIFMMIIGRVGVLAFAYIVVGTATSNGVEYSEENLMVG